MSQKRSNSITDFPMDTSVHSPNPLSRSLEPSSVARYSKKASLFEDIRSNLENTLIEPVPLPKKELRESVALLPDELSGEEGEGHGHNSGSLKSNVFISSLNIANTCLGAGILELAYVMKEFGVLLSFVIFIISYLLCVCSCFLLLKAKNLSGHSKYSTIGVSAIGRHGEKVIKFMVIVNNFGLCIVYLILFGRTCHNILHIIFSSTPEGAFLISPKFLIPIVALIMLPLTFAKKMARLKIVSVIAVSAITLFSILTIVTFIRKWSSGTLPGGINILPSKDFSTVNALSCVPTVFLAFTFQFNFFPVYKSLSDANDTRMRKVTMISLSMVLGFYMLVALCGYLSYGDKITNNGLIDNFTPEDLTTPIYLILMTCFLCSSTLCFPMMFFGARNNIWSVVLGITKYFNKKWKSSQVENGGSEENTEPILSPAVSKTSVIISWKYYCGYVLILYVLVVLSAMYATGIGSILNIVGAVAANAISYVFPSLFYVMLTKNKHQKWWYISWFMLIFGIICGGISLVMEIISFTQK